MSAAYLTGAYNKNAYVYQTVPVNKADVCFNVYGTASAHSVSTLHEDRAFGWSWKSGMRMTRGMASQGVQRYIFGGADGIVYREAAAHGRGGPRGGGHGGVPEQRERPGL